MTLYQSYDPDGTFEIRATTHDDNNGVSGWAFDLDGILTAANVSPYSQFDPSAVAARGFTFGRVTSLAAPGGNIGGVQDPVAIDANPAAALLLVGQVGGDLDSVAGLFPEPDGVYDADVLLVTGTWNPAGPFPTLTNAVASVFAEGTTQQVLASVDAGFPPTPPEPASLALMLVGGLVLRRRKSGALAPTAVIRHEMWISRSRHRCA